MKKRLIILSVILIFICITFIPKSEDNNANNFVKENISI